MTHCFAIDISGSVARANDYWNVVSKLVHEVPADTPVHIICWNVRARALTPHEVATTRALVTPTQWTDALKPECGTCPDSILHSLPPAFERFTLLTDGETDQRSVERLDTQISEYEAFTKCAHIDCHLINSGTLNLSVTAAFTRFPNATVWKHNGQESTRIFSMDPEQLRVVQQLDTLSLDEWIDQHETLLRTMTALFMGRSGDPALHARLVVWKRRLETEFRARANDRQRIDWSTATLSLRFGAQLIRDFYASNTSIDTLRESLNRALTIVERGLRGQFSTNVFDLANVTAPTVMEPDVPDELPELTIETTPVFECPILLTETAVPVLTIRAGEPILQGLDKALVDNIRRNPLAMIDNADIIARVRQRVSPYMLSYETAHTLLGRGEALDPFSRAPIVGVIPLHHDMARIANKNVALLFTGGIAFGQIDLMYIALYAIARHWISNTDADTIRAVWDDTIDHRLRMSRTALSLSGLVDRVSLTAPIYAGIWFVLHSGEWAFPNESMRPLRDHVFVASALLMLYRRAEAMGLVPAITDDVLDSIDATHMGLTMLHACKHDSWWPQYLKSLRGHYVQLADVVVPIEGGGTEESYVFLPTLDRWRHIKPPSGRVASRAWMLTLAKSVAPNMSASSWGKEMNGSLWRAAAQLVPPLVETAPFWHMFAEDDARVRERTTEHARWVPVPICLATCRPYSRIVATHEPWATMVSRELHLAVPLHPTVASVNAWFGEYVCKYNAYPTLVPFWAYVAKTQLRDRPLPIIYRVMFDAVLEDFADAMATLEPAEFARRFRASAPMAIRQSLEQIE